MADTLANNVDEREKLIPDLDDPEFQKELQRPAHIKADMMNMERQRRVSLILNSQAFREELESIIESQLKSGPHPASLIALQQIADLVLPQSRFNQSSAGGGGGGGRGQAGTCLIPVADIRGVDSVNYSKGEKILRCKLASLYRLIDIQGWTQHIYNHISLRVSMETDNFLINPFGLMYHEITASSLVKVDMLGQVVDPGTTTYGPNVSGLTLHSAIHHCRPDAKCIVHIHNPDVVAVSSMKCGLLPLSQEALICGDVSYYDYSGIFIGEQQKDDIIRALGPNNKILFLRNHGVACCGETVEEAYYWTAQIVSACTSQVRSMSAGIDNLILLPDSLKEETRKTALQGASLPINVEHEEGEKPRERKWKVGELEFEAMMRQLDNQGHRTGYVYHQPLIRSDPKPRSEVAHPAASTSVTYFYDDDRESSKYQSPMKLMNRKQAGEKTKWLNTPNTYTKVEMQEELKEGDETPKKKTVWVSDVEKQSSGDPIQIEAHQFSKLSDDPKELKKRQKDIKADRFDDKVTAGPISEVLSGVQYGDTRKQQLARDAPLSDSKECLHESPKQGGGGDQIHAASKGIIERSHQKDALLYTAYAPNPFENMSEEDILQYKKEIAEKTGQDVKEIELIVQAPDSQMNGPDGMDETTTTTTKREVVVTKGEDGSEIKTTRVVTTKFTTKETTLNGDEAEVEEGEDDDERAASPQDAALRSASSAEASPTKDATSPSKKKDKDKQKKKFRTPSFLKKKKEKADS